MATWRRACISRSKVHAYTWRGLFSTSDFRARNRKHRSRCFFNFILFYFFVLHAPDRAKSRRFLHGVVWRLFLFLFSAFAGFWKSWRHLLVASSTLPLTVPILLMARTSKPGQLSKSNFTFKIVELVSLDVNIWTQGFCENYDFYNITGFISCGFRQTLVLRSRISQGRVLQTLATWSCYNWETRQNFVWFARWGHHYNKEEVCQELNEGSC